MSVRFITFATQTYLDSAGLACSSAMKFGCSECKIYMPEDLINLEDDVVVTVDFSKVDFTTRGAGYWLWKPAIILYELSKMKDGEVLIYCDSGVLPTSNLKNLFLDELDKEVFLWTNGSKNNSILEWTDEKVLKELKVNGSDSEEAMVIAGFIVVKNTEHSRNFIREWLKLCENRNLLCPDSLENYQPSPRVIWHRHDQSLLSILAYSNPNIVRVNTLSTFLLSNVGTPFLVHRNPKASSPISVHMQVKAKFIIRKLISVLPKRLRVMVRISFNRKMISETELNRHKQIL